MAFADLTPEQQNVVAEYVRLLRAWTGEQARANNHAAAINDGYAQVQSILDQLQIDDMITDSTGLAGAMTLTKGEVISLTAHMQGILTNYNTAGHRQMWAKAAGPANLIG